MNLTLAVLYIVKKMNHTYRHCTINGGVRMNGRMTHVSMYLKIWPCMKRFCVPDFQIHYGATGKSNLSAVHSIK